MTTEAQGGRREVRIDTENETTENWIIRDSARCRGSRSVGRFARDRARAWLFPPPSSLLPTLHRKKLHLLDAHHFLLFTSLCSRGTRDSSPRAIPDSEIVRDEKSLWYFFFVSDIKKLEVNWISRAYHSRSDGTDWEEYTLFLIVSLISNSIWTCVPDSRWKWILSEPIVTYISCKGKKENKFTWLFISLTLYYIMLQ